MSRENTSRKTQLSHGSRQDPAGEHDPMDLTSPEWEEKFRRIRRGALHVQGETPDDAVRTGFADSRESR